MPKRGYRFIAPVNFSPPTHRWRLPHQPNHCRLAETQTDRIDAPAHFSTSAFVHVAVITSLVLGLMFLTANSRRPAPAVAATPQALIPDEAKGLYARGRIALTRRSEEGLRNGASLFSRAIEVAPSYDAAYVGVADAWSLLASYGMHEPREAMTRARENAASALAINPGSAEAHASLGRTSMIADWNWQLSERHFQRAIALSPKYATAHQWYAYLLSATGRHREAEREARLAAELEPLSLNAATAVGFVQYAARQYVRAAATLRGVLEIDPDFTQARRNLALVLAMQGDHSQAVKECERVARLTAESNASLADLAWVLGRSGDRDAARGILLRLQERNAAHYVPGDLLARALLGAGYQDRALDAIAEAFALRVPTLASLSVDPVWDELRETPTLRRLAESLK